MVACIGAGTRRSPAAPKGGGSRPGLPVGRGGLGETVWRWQGAPGGGGVGGGRSGLGRRLGAGYAVVLPAWCQDTRPEGLHPSRHTAEIAENANKTG